MSKNRAIKFRAWDGKRMESEVDLFFMDGEIAAIGGYQCQSSDSYKRREINEGITVMQFTGLLDKNGVEIYEGDVVVFAESEVYKIVYSDQKACFSLDGAGRFADIMAVIAVARQGQLTSIYTDKDFEVIGNIHENPDMLQSA